jgi:ketosteroid isomerase-like protein
MMADHLSDDDKLAIARRFAQASRTNDREAYAALCAPGATTWHNFDAAEMTTEQTLRTIGWLHRTVTDLAWTDVSLLPTPRGFVSQTIMTGTVKERPLRVHSCVVVTLDADGLVAHVEEYLDTAQTAVLAG